jgi:type III secretory pathway component EscR
VNGIINKIVEIIKASPRIVLAILLGILISKPLELKIFEQEIETELVKIQQIVSKEQEDKIKERYLPNIERTNTEIAKFQSEIDNKKQEYNNREKIAQQEADGTGGSGNPNLGPIYKVKKEDANRAYNEYQIVYAKNQPEIDKLREQNSKEEEKMKAEFTNSEKVKFDGLLARLNALGSLAEQDDTANQTITGVNLLFIFFEVVPLLFKILTDRGIYDIKLEKVEEKVRASEIEKISSLNDEINRKINLKMAENQNILERESEDNRLLMKKISDAQFAITDKILSDWKKRELQKIEDEPHKYIG